ncbi:MAG TPA: (d)CMP kinase [Anaerolineales bacterium]|jgi:cytidylate kinase
MGAANIIAIDGPAGSGKSTLGEMLANYLGYLYFDSGIMYRAVTWYALQHGVPIEGEAAITQLAEQLDIDVLPADQPNGRSYKVLVDGQDVTYRIRSPEVESHVSVVSAYPGVRRALSEQQRRVGLRGRVVMVGRDIGTVVLPEADLKVYLDASVEERARRRFSELRERQEPASLAAIMESMRRRDRIDSTREVAPLRAAEDAIVLVTDGLEIGQVFERLKSLAERGCG